MKQKIIDWCLFNLILTIPFVQIGCGFFDNNTQPTIQPISDKTLEIGKSSRIYVIIDDIDEHDEHIIEAFSADTRIATVTSDNTSLLIKGIAAGITTITVTVSDDSGQDNATSIPVMFQVTINEPPEKVATLDGDSAIFVACLITFWIFCD